MSDDTGDRDLTQDAYEALKSLATALGLAELEFDDNNECVITLDERVVVAMALDLDTQSIVLSIPLGYLPQNAQRESLMFRLLAGNHYWALTEGGTLGVDESTDLINLTYLAPLPLAEPAQFVIIVGRLVSAANYWLDKIGKANAGGAAFSVPQSSDALMRV
jgi:hypothetical protein